MGPRKGKAVVWTAGLSAAGLAVALFAGSVPRPGQKPTSTLENGPPTATAQAGGLAQTIRVTGSTRAEQGIMLRAPYLGGNRGRGSAGDFNLELSQLIEPGRHVREGEVVAVFDNENMRNRLDNDEADVAQAEGTLKRLRADQAATMEAHQQSIRVAQSAVDGAALDLKTVRVRSAIDAQKFALTLEEAQATLASLKAETPNLRARQAAELRSAELELERATVEAKRSRINLERLTVRAPMDGLVVAEQIYRNGQFGQIRQGDQLHAGQPYVRIADLRKMVVEATANQVDAADLRIGRPARVQFDAYPGNVLSGRVEGVGAMARAGGSRASFVADIPLTISLDKTDGRVIPGLTVHCDVEVAVAEKAAVVPSKAIFYDGDRPYAFVRTPAGWERREVDVELSDHLNSAVKSGVTPGDLVALEPPG